MKNFYRKSFTLNKIDFNRTGRRINQVTIDIELELKKNESKLLTATLENVNSSYYVLAIQGNIWNSVQTDCLCWGQCLGELRKFYGGLNGHKQPWFKFWDKYHLNDMKLGTDRQQKVVDKYLLESKTSFDYDVVCEVLKEQNLYIDRGYEYASKWLLKPIPQDDINTMIELLSE